jgi:acyl carrier protein
MPRFLAGRDFRRPATVAGKNMGDYMELEKHIRQYVAENLLYVDEDFKYDNDTSFINEGLIDSMGVMELVAYVQSEFDITVEQQEMTPDNFDSVNKLVTFIRGKQAAKAQSA